MPMLETAIALAFGHLVGDFLLQANWMVRDKHRPQVLAAHVAVVLACTWAALGFAPQPLLLLLIYLTHVATDWLKLRLGGPGLGPFVADQAAHFAAIGLGAALFPAAYGSGLWGLLADGRLAVPVALLPAAMALGSGFVACIWAGDYAVRALMSGLPQPAPESLPKGGRLIGRLERAMILMLVIAGRADGIGFLIAAKSVLRFNELARDDDRRVSEYVIIGTLASFAWGLGAAFLARMALHALGP
jgi:hypothetical protein